MLFCPSLLARLLLAGGGKGGRAKSAEGVVAAMAATFAAAAANAEAPETRTAQTRALLLKFVQSHEKG